MGYRIGDDLYMLCAPSPADAAGPPALKLGPASAAGDGGAVASGHIAGGPPSAVATTRRSLLPPIRPGVLRVPPEKLANYSGARDDNRRVSASQPGTDGRDGGCYDVAVALHPAARDYSPGLGRWTEGHPAAYVGGSNLYQAFSGDPSSATDPVGTLPATSQPSSSPSPVFTLATAIDWSKDGSKGGYWYEMKMAMPDKSTNFIQVNIWESWRWDRMLDGSAKLTKTGPLIGLDYIGTDRTAGNIDGIPLNDDEVLDTQSSLPPYLCDKTIVARVHAIYRVTSEKGPLAFGFPETRDGVELGYGGYRMSADDRVWLANRTPKGLEVPFANQRGPLATLGTYIGGYVTVFQAVKDVSGATGSRLDIVASSASYSGRTVFQNGLDIGPPSGLPSVDNVDSEIRDVVADPYTIRGRR
jgi:RHS repeat-associated protein